jgi:purine-binding chemotaxis protein CheW
MSKTPEEFFQDQEFQAEPREQEEGFTEAERAFIEKYMGLEEADILEKLGIDAPAEATSVPLPDAGQELSPEPEPAPEPVPEPEPAPEMEAGAEEVVAPATGVELAPEEEVPLERELQQCDDIQLVSLYVGKHEYTLPIQAVQEVVRVIKPTQVPEAPPHMAGLVNLRGRVTPVIRMDVLLGVERDQDTLDREAAGETMDKFIIICRKKGLQVGLLVREVATMYRVTQDRIEWNIESKIGGNIELVTALLRREDDSLVGILSVDRVVEKLLKR